MSNFEKSKTSKNGFTTINNEQCLADSQAQAENADENERSKMAGDKISTGADSTTKEKTSSSSRNRKPSRRKSSASRRSRSPRKRSGSPGHSSHRKHKSSYRKSTTSSYHRQRLSPLHLHRRRSTSRDQIAEFLARTRRTTRHSRSRSKSPYDPYAALSKRSRTRSRSPKQAKRKDNEIFHEKLTLTALGKWDGELEFKWKMMEKEEDMLKKKFQVYRKRLEEKPEEHPKYAGEWKEFWEKKFQEVEAAGKEDPEGYDYVPEWKVFWANRVEDLMGIEFAAEVDFIRRQNGMDINCLRRLSTGVERQDSFNDNLNPEIQLQPKQDFVAARSMSMSSAPVHDNVRVRHEEERSSFKDDISQVPVTINDVKSTWESLTGQRIGNFSATIAANTTMGKPDSTAAPAASGSNNVNDNEHEFDSFNLVQVLQLISGQEDQLSFLTSRVQEYLTKAEELELSKPKQSYTLLKNEDFVSLILKCRDRFNSLIRANILPRNTLKTLNLSMYMLNLVLGTPTCQKVTITSRINSAHQNDAPSSTNSSKRGSGSDSRMGQAATQELLATVSEEQKRAIVTLLTANLMAKGNRSVTDADLGNYVFSVIHALVKKKSVLKKQPVPVPVIIDLEEAVSSTAPITHVRNYRDRDRSSLNRSPSPTPVEDNSRYGLANRVVGTALPPLPKFMVRAYSP